MALRLIGRDKDSFVINANENVQRRSEARNSKYESIKLHNKSLNMSGINGDKDSVLSRKMLARKRAMKMVRDAWAGDQKIDMDIDELRVKGAEKKTEIYEYNDHIRACKDRKEELREYYGIENGEFTEEDMELLERKRSAQPGEDVSFTEAEQKRLAELESPEFARYQEQVQGLDLAMEQYGMKAERAWQDVSIYNSEVRGIKLERLKFHDMLDAQKKAAKINEAASKDAIGMLTGEATDHIKETLEEKREEAKEKAEEKEEQEEKLEEKREEKEELQAQLEIKREERSSEAERTRLEQEKSAREQEEIIEGAKENLGDPGANASQLKSEIKEMLQKMKLLEEDLKGAEIDDTV